MSYKRNTITPVFVAIALPFLFGLSGCSSMAEHVTTSPVYLKIGTGLKFQENYMEFDDGSGQSDISARIELYQEFGNISYGISHHSQWFDGWPFNGDMEYVKSEIFVDYKFELKVK